MSEATLNALLAELHLKTVEQLLERVTSGKASAQELNVARQLLKDNNVEAKPVAGSPLAGLADSLPDLDPVDEGEFYPKH